MSKVICYPKVNEPKKFDDAITYIELLSNPILKGENRGSVGATLLADIRRAGVVPPIEAIDFALIAFSVVAADNIILRKYSPNGWTRQIDMTIFLNDPDKWTSIRSKMESMLRFLTGDFWSLEFIAMAEKTKLNSKVKSRQADCVCLLSGGMDSLVGAIDLVFSKRSPLFVSQIMRGDSDSQKIFADRLGKNNHCQWSSSVNKLGESEGSTRARSIMFFAFALLASYGVGSDSKKRKEIIIPENGYMSLNVPLNTNRISSLSTKTTHPIYMTYLQEIWNDVGINVDLVLPYKYKTKGEVIMECKSQSLLIDCLPRSISCGKYRRNGLQHCGACVPCLIRRAAFLKAGLKDETLKGYKIDNLKYANSEDVNAVVIALKNVEYYGVESFIKSNLSFASGDDRNHLRGVVFRGIEELGALLKVQGVL